MPIGNPLPSVDDRIDVSGTPPLRGRWASTTLPSRASDAASRLSLRRNANQRISKLHHLHFAPLPHTHWSTVIPPPSPSFSYEHLRNLHNSLRIEHSPSRSCPSPKQTPPTASTTARRRDHPVDPPRQPDPEPPQHVCQRPARDQRHDDQHKQLHRVPPRVVVQLAQVLLDFVHHPVDEAVAGACAAAVAAAGKDPAGGGGGGTGGGGVRADEVVLRFIVFFVVGLGGVSVVMVRGGGVVRGGAPFGRVGAVEPGHVVWMGWSTEWRWMRGSLRTDVGCGDVRKEW